MHAPLPASRVIPANEYRRERWSNGLGWTREIARGHAHPAQEPAHPRADFSTSGDWTWRLSIAEIEQDAAFSWFPGAERVLVLLEGEGLRLRFSRSEVATLEPPHGAFRFDGARAVAGEPVGGRAVVFNLIWRREAIDAELWRRPLVGATVIFLEPGETWALHLIAGDARFDDGSGLPQVATGDTALLATSAGARGRYVVDGSGEALLVRLRPIRSAAARRETQ